jgi:sensor histidine kinase YesM
MAITRKSLLTQVRDLLLFALASLAQGYLLCYGCTRFRTYVLVICFTFVMWVFLWKGNSLVTRFVSKRISWLHEPVKRLIIGVISTVGYTLLTIVTAMWCFESFFHLHFGTGYSSTLVGSMILTIIISLILHSREFLMHWKKATIEREKFEKESAIARYESLKNQVNPHFLFNSFNVLSNLVYQDQDMAVKFIKQLSDVYRYVLDTREKEVVSLEEELKFLESYLYLQHIRFGDKLNVDVSLDKGTGVIAPLALQMLIENAIKHNVVSEDDPLSIRVYSDQDHIIVENNLQLKETLAEPSAGVGLENICKRYSFLSDLKVEILKTEKKFIVKLPSLNRPDSSAI